MERPFGASYLTLSSREALEPAVGAPALAVHGSGFKVQSSATTEVRGQAHALAAALGSAKRPLVVIGLSIDPANAARIRRWVNEWNLPVAVTPKVKGIVDETAANFVGVAGGMAADGVMCAAIARSRSRRRLRPRPGRGRQDLARGPADSLGARIAECGWRRANGRRVRGPRGDSRRAGRAGAARAVAVAVQGAPGNARADAERPRRVRRHDVARRHRAGPRVGDAAPRRSSRPTSGRTNTSSGSTGRAGSRKPSGCRTGCRGWPTG